MATSHWRDDPDLVIVGVKRGGTTSLFRDLERHPGMCPLIPSANRFPLRENQKGVHFFDSNFDRGHTWYRSHFPTRFSRRLTERRVGSTFTAEASPYYFFHPLAAQRIAAALPHALFVVLLRDPVERTVSHWSEQTRNGVETLPLRAALDAEEGRLGQSATQLEGGAVATSHAHEQQSFATQSEYADSLRRWFDWAGRDRVHVAFSEDYYGDPAAVVGAITDRIGVARMPPDAVGDHRNAASRPTDLDPDIELRLIDRFRPDVERVTALLGTRPPWPRFELQRRDTSAMDGP
jgi:Sulfotransferase family